MLPLPETRLAQFANNKAAANNKNRRKVIQIYPLATSICEIQLYVAQVRLIVKRQYAAELIFIHPSNNSADQITLTMRLFYGLCRDGREYFV
jgi:hypothetical protein